MKSGPPSANLACRPVDDDLVRQACERFPVLLERRKQAAGTLSGGQQRQLEMARSLMHDPVLFLINESAAGIEPRVAGLIYEMIKDLAAQGKAVLQVDQNIKRALEIADYVYVMRTGTVLSQGSPEESAATLRRWSRAGPTPAATCSRHNPRTQPARDLSP